MEQQISPPAENEHLIIGLGEIVINKQAYDSPSIPMQKSLLDLCLGKEKSIHLHSSYLKFSLLVPSFVRSFHFNIIPIFLVTLANKNVLEFE